MFEADKSVPVVDLWIMSLKRSIAVLIFQLVYLTNLRTAIEGINNKLKLIKRRAFAFKNFNNFQLRSILT